MNEAEKTILLIDDDPDLHSLTRRALMYGSMKVLSAYNGAQGLAKMLKHRPHLVLLDHMMPVMDGVSVFRELMSSPKYDELRDIPVIMLTAAIKDQEEVEVLLEMGLAAYLTKPFGQKELLSVIRNHLIQNGVRLRHAQLQSTIRQARDFLESLVESAPIAIMATDTIGKLTYFSRGAEELLGYETGEVTALPIEDLVIEENGKLADHLNEPQAGDQRRAFEINFRSKSGAAVATSLTVSELCNAEGETCGLLYVGIDLSEIRRLQEALIEQERLAAITEAVATVNHEINNPLTPILGNIQLLLAESDALDEPTQRRLRIIESNAWKIHETVIKLTRIIRPIRTRYSGDSNMIDLDSATAPPE
jgi:PAS domain S-box-containing protein